MVIDKGLCHEAAGLQAPSLPWRHGRGSGVKKGSLESRGKRQAGNTEPRQVCLGAVRELQQLLCLTHRVCTGRIHEGNCARIFSLNPQQ